MPGALHVAVVGPGDATTAECHVAYELGAIIAQRGAVLVTGGLGGVMAAAADGCRDAGGVSIGVLPGDSRAGHSTVELPTGLGELRNGLVVRCADAVIAVGGSWGTLSEIALARRTGRQVVSIGGWQLLDEHGQPVDLARAATPSEALDQVLPRQA